MSELETNLALKRPISENATPSPRTCEIPNGYNISSAYYAGAMGLSMPTRSANQSESKGQPRTQRPSKPKLSRVTGLTDSMVQFELDLSEVPNA